MSPINIPDQTFGDQKRVSPTIHPELRYPDKRGDESAVDPLVRRRCERRGLAHQWPYLVDD